MCDPGLLVASDRKPNPNLIKQVGEFMSSGNWKVLVLADQSEAWSDHKQCYQVPIFSSSLAPLVGFILGLPGSQQPCPQIWEQPSCPHISRPTGKKTCLCPGIPSKSLPVGHMSIPEPITGSRLGACAHWLVWVQVPALPLNTRVERRGPRGWLSRGQSGYHLNKKGMYILETNLQWLNMAFFHHFSFLQNLPENPPALPGSIP